MHAARKRANEPGDTALRKPITCTAFCCARAASGQATTELPAKNALRQAWLGPPCLENNRPERHACRLAAEFPHY